MHMKMRLYDTLIRVKKPYFNNHDH